MIVMKFGGSSVESAAAIDRVASIVRSRLERQPIVVVSAMGKTTNRLLAIAQSAVSGDRAGARAQLDGLKTYTLREGGPVGGAIEAHFHELSELVQGLSILGELSPRSIDAISAYGERLSSLIVAERFRSQGLDAVQADSRDYVVTDARHTQAAPLYPETYERLARLQDLARKHVVVMGGFIGSTTSGVTTTLGRGGSDFSASIIGAGLGADEIQIWTDVDGMLTCDPRIAGIGHRVKLISFGEAAELAYFGAKVLHPSTVLPAVEKNIPVYILNSRRPEVEGTRIVAETVPCANTFKAIACKQDIISVHIRSTRMLMAHGFLRRIFEVFDRYETAVDMIATSEISVSLTIDNPHRLDAILAELREFAEATVETGQAIICMVGENIGASHGVAGRVFQSMIGTNIRMISQGASSLNLSFVVAGKDLVSGVTALHREFFSDLDPNIFEKAGHGMRVAIVGYGKMGRMIEGLAPQYGIEVSHRLDVGWADADLAATPPDAAIEFSTPEAAVSNLERLAALRVPVVCGTTGWFGELERIRLAFDRHRTALVYSANYSIGVNIFQRLAAEAARLFENEAQYEAWAWEIHHGAKKDSPSGTLLQLTAAMRAAGYSRPIDESASRAGAHPGTHEIGFDSAADTITLRHTARSREGFARGALRAASWIEGKQGVHSFAGVLFGNVK